MKKAISNPITEDKIEHDVLVKGGYHSVLNLEEEKKKMSEVAKNTLAKRRARA